jgi:hypothetical protein
MKLRHNRASCSDRVRPYSCLGEVQQRAPLLGLRTGPDGAVELQAVCSEMPGRAQWRARRTA